MTLQCEPPLTKPSKPVSAPTFRKQRADVDDDAELKPEVVQLIVEAWAYTARARDDARDSERVMFGVALRAIFEWRHRSEMIAVATDLGVSKRLARTLLRRFEQAWPRASHEGTRDEQIARLIHGVLLRDEAALR